MTGRVQTVLGPVAPDAIGPTLMHEHLICDVTPPELAALDGTEPLITLENVFDIRYEWGVNHLGNHRLNDEAMAVAELARLRQAGGTALVEVSGTGLRPNPAALARIARASGIHVIAGCGPYIESYLAPKEREKSADRIAQDLVAALTTGYGDSGVRAGIIGEIGCSWPWTEAERRAMQGAVLAQQQTGAAITVHPGRHVTAPFEIANFVAAAGGDPSRLIIGHLDRTLLDSDDALRLAETGVVLEYDFFGIESSYYPFQDIDLPNDGQRLRMIRHLVDRGHVGQILLSQDICTRTRLVTFGGHGYGYLFRRIIPLMRKRGFTDDDIITMTIATPARLLARPI